MPRTDPRGGQGERRLTGAVWSRWSGAGGSGPGLESLRAAQRKTGLLQVPTLAAQRDTTHSIVVIQINIFKLKKY